MAKVTDLHGRPGADATKVTFSEFKSEEIASSPEPSLFSTGGESQVASEPSAFDEIVDGVMSSTSDLSDDVADRVQIDKVETLAKDMLQNDELVNELKDIDFWKDVAKGDADIDGLMETSGIGGLVNSITGEDCMKTDLSDFWNDILDKLLERGWELGDNKFFECLLEDLKNMGIGFVNSVGANIETILKDESMAALKGVGDVLEDEAKDALPEFKEGLKSFAGVGADDAEGEGNFINDVMCTFDEDWAKTDNGDIDLDTFDSASPSAKSGLATVDDDDIGMGLTISGLFEDALDVGNSYISETPGFTI